MEIEMYNRLVWHRSQIVICYVMDSRTDVQVEGHERILIQLEDLKWWIAPLYGEDQCDDIGPYETAEDAMTMFLLMFDRSKENDASN
jgi:hypothetical protein